MKKSFFLFHFVAVLVVLNVSACDKEPSNEPRITFKIDNKRVNQDNISVSLGGQKVVRVETIGHNPGYLRQINNKTPNNLEKSDDLQTLEYTTSSNYTHKIVEIYTSFPDSIFQKNDVISIIVSVEGLSKSLNYVIE